MRNTAKVGWKRDRDGPVAGGNQEVSPERFPQYGASIKRSWRA